MLVWDETDVLTCLEVMPEVEPDGIWHKYCVSKDGLTLEILIYQYDGDVTFTLVQAGVDSPVFHMQLIDCSGVKYCSDRDAEYLEFAPAHCFGGRYDGEERIPYGVRVKIRPSIQVWVF